MYSLGWHNYFPLITVTNVVLNGADMVHLPNKKVVQSPKDGVLLANCKYFKGEDENPFKDTSSVEACFWDIERIATREVARESSIMLSDAKLDLTRVSLPQKIVDTIPAPILLVAFVIFGRQSTAPYWSSEFAKNFETFIRSGYNV